MQSNRLTVDCACDGWAKVGSFWSVMVPVCFSILISPILSRQNMRARQRHMTG